MTEIRHRVSAGVTGYKRWGCRCPECTEAGEEYRKREQDRRKQKRAGMAGEFEHGVTGYRQYGCRCQLCTEAGDLFNREKRVQLPEGDWSELSHLIPGHGVRKRKAR